MSETLEQIAEVQSAMKLALACEDWETLSTLDLKCRDLVTEAVDKVSDAVDMEAGDKLIVHDAILPLLALYRQTVTACELHRDQLAAELQGFKRQKTGAKAYQSCQF